MYGAVPFELPAALVRLHHGLDFWHNEGRWDCEGFNWIAERQRGQHPLRIALMENRIPSFAFAEDGTLERIPTHLWSGTYLWGEAYSKGLVNVRLERGIIQGYLCVERAALENVWACSHSSRISLVTVELAEALSLENPALGLVVKALGSDAVDTSSVKTIEAWLRKNWPPELHAIWPDREASNPPSLARQINTVVRYAKQFHLTWKGAPPEDDLTSKLASEYPILAAALEVCRLCRNGELAHDRGRTVRPKAAEAEILKRLNQDVTKLRDGRFFLQRTARISIPEERVSGGGRDRDKAR